MAYRRNAKEDKPLAPFEGKVSKWEKKFVPYVIGKVNGEVRLELMKWQKSGQFILHVPILGRVG
jgi:hypothetical protein